MIEFVDLSEDSRQKERLFLQLVKLEKKKKAGKGGVSSLFSRSVFYLSPFYIAFEWTVLSKVAAS